MWESLRGSNIGSNSISTFTINALGDFILQTIFDNEFMGIKGE